ncbi:FliM/FliN family flagellar motor C-terminal domain-containing protein [Legionella sp.]|uniref:FliM/FliN family flagellar motor C-terminal domain-containing protein n=1 Tax=Legionella sp. TaxID=459 RepID=UPI000CB2CAAE|nr:FliM/FliN family flagellar motor C-terminal domain-containing protein [Legionella sp.]PJE10990.1 MAG: hypothetical protein CK430_09340 [Legionella sp.]
MKVNPKPYRMISHNELNYFQQNFSEKLDAWNEIYATENLKLSVNRTSAINHCVELQLLVHEHKPVALVDSSYLSVLKKNLFAVSDDCFNEACNEIFMQLLKQFFVVDSLELRSNSTSYSEWIYPGSACLNIVFANENELNLYLHPAWVLAHLPQTKHSAKPLGRLDEVLATKKLCLTVQLEPLRLNVEKLLSLQVGDVIKTDHSLNKPLEIQYRQHTLCEGIVGQHKTIQLTRSS